MNEIKKIHLGRQPFTISTKAYKELQAYLAAIEQQVGEQPEVIKEVELRMAELLTDRGLSAEKVVLEEDIAYLREQLGEPQDFKDEAEQEVPDEASGTTSKTNKRLYRDTERGMIAGVAAGLAAYFRVDPLIMRLIFVALTFAGGSGIVLYVLLWLLVPEAKTASDQLQLRGKAVNVQTLKEVVDRADLPGATSRATRVIRRLLRLIMRIAREVIALAVSVAAGLLLLATLFATSVLLIHHVEIAGQKIFPMGAQAVLALLCAAAAVSVIGMLVLLAGYALSRRRAVVAGWVVAAMAGLFFVTASVGGALSLNVAGQIRDKYNSLHHVQTVQLAPFQRLDLSGTADFYYVETSDRYAVEIEQLGVQPKPIKTEVRDGTLYISANINKSDVHDPLHEAFDQNFPRIRIYAPRLQHIQGGGQTHLIWPGDGIPVDFEGSPTAAPALPVKN